MSEFERGIFYAAYLICELHDHQTIAADVIREANLENADISGLDDCEKDMLLELNKSEHLNLKVK